MPGWAYWRDMVPENTCRFCQTTRLERVSVRAIMSRDDFTQLARQRFGVCVAATLIVIVQACAAGSDTDTRQLPPSAPMIDAGGPPVIDAPICPPSNPFCIANPDEAPISTGVTTPTSTTCASEPIDLTPAGINIMIAVDGSASMMTHWTRIQEAIRGVRKNNPKSAIGIQIFWAELVESLEEGLEKSNACGATQNRVLDVGAYDEQQLVNFLGAGPPGPDFLGGLYEISPVVDPLNYYLTNASKLADPKRTNYLVFVTDGNDNCFGSVFTRKEDKLLAYEKLAIELLKLNIRTIPVGFDAASMPESTGIFGTTQPNTDLDVLSTLLKHGGSGLPEIPKVDDPAKLAQVISQVGQSVRNCRFEIPAALDPTAAGAVNPFELTFAINGKAIARDRLGTEGWNFVNGNTAQVELYGQACQAIRADQQLVAKKTCETEVCGTAAVRVETKPRAVLFLLDASASRIECEDGTLDCLPGIGDPRTRAFWEVVEGALGQSLTVPINDDVDFGMQFFPGKNAAFLSCDLATSAEIPPTSGTELTIMRQMYEKLPLGFSPVVQILEAVAASPGRLADPGVLGSVVMLTDGGDNCSGEDQAGIIRRLGAAAKSLLDKGIKTYVIRYGSEAGRTPEGDEQLRAIVSNGGTDESSPSDPSKQPYVDARDETQLNAALTSISDRLATCSFTMGNLPTDVDKAKANLYLNGEVIPFDAMGTKQKGWSWVDAEKTTAELYGDSCTAFKTNRRTSVVVEFGCVQIPVVLL